MEIRVLWEKINREEIKSSEAKTLEALTAEVNQGHRYEEETCQ
jgi:hypothetical protein